MPFKKGVTTNPEGRPKGTKNKVTTNLRETIGNFLQANFQKITEDFEGLPPKDRAKLYCDLLQYSLPKLQAVTVETDLERLTEGELDQIIDSLKASAQ